MARVSRNYILSVLIDRKEIIRQRVKRGVFGDESSVPIDNHDCEIEL